MPDHDLQRFIPAVPPMIHLGGKPHVMRRFPDTRTLNNIMWLAERIRANTVNRKHYIVHMRTLLMEVHDSMPPEWRRLVWEYGDGIIVLFLGGYDVGDAVSIVVDKRHNVRP